MAKEGPKEKDREITEGFNPDKIGALSKTALEKIGREERKALKDANKASAPSSEADLLRLALGEEDDSSYNMLLDMRWAYKKVKGKKKLLTLIEEDDKQFVVMVKELMRLESILLAAKLRRDGDGSEKQAVFVVLKGLEKMPEGCSDGIDVQQITKAISPGGVK